MITVKGTLTAGFTDEAGVVHKDFEMQQATIAHAVSAIEKRGQEDETGLRLRIFKIAEQLLTLGTLDKSLITGEMLLGLEEDDITPLFDAQDELEKKLKSSRTPSANTSQ